MSRTVALECEVCRRKFGGDETLKRHRVIAGDRYRCLSDAELIVKGLRQDTRDGVWRRPRLDQLTFPSLSVGQSDDLILPDEVSDVPDTDPRLLARTSDPSTSHRAAQSAAPRTGTYKRLLLDAIAASPDGLTFEEAALRVGMDPWQASKRVSDLKRDGLVVVDGERTGRSGKAQEVCRVAEAVA